MKPLVRLILDIWPDGRFEIVSSTTTSEESLPQVVTLDMSDPDFEKKKEELKAKGYKWNRRNKDWRLPRSQNGSQESLPQVVSLDKSDPDFEKKKEELKAKGYKWDNTNKVWRLPADSKTSAKPSNFEGWWGDATEVKLNKGDPDFETKKDALKAAGATWDGPDQVWVLPAKKPW